MPYIKTRTGYQILWNVFFGKDPKLPGICLLSKMYNWFHNVPGRPLIPNYGYYMENILSFIVYHFQRQARNLKPYIKETRFW